MDQKKEKEGTRVLESWDWLSFLLFLSLFFYDSWLGREDFGEVSNLGSILAYFTRVDFSTQIYIYIVIVMRVLNTPSIKSLFIKKC